MRTVTSVSAGDRSEFDWGSITWLHSGKFSGARELTVGEVVIKSGCSNPAHAHPNCEEVLYLIEGELDHTIEGQGAVHLAAGDAICVPRGLKHNATCTSAQDARMVVAYSSAFREVAGE